jgi:hypothetical protein
VRTARNATPHVSVTVKRSVDVNPDVAKRVMLTQDRQADLHTANLSTADLLLIDILDIER